MKDVIKVYRGGHAFLGKKTETDGYSGACERLFNAVTQTIIKPGASLEEVKRSLQLTIQDIDLRISHNGRLAKSNPVKKERPKKSNAGKK